MCEIRRMSWLAVLVGLTVAAPPEVDQTVVLVSRRTAVTPAQARTLALDGSKYLAAAGVSVAMSPDAALTQLARVSVKDTASCNGKRACLAELGRQLKVPWVVLISVASIDKELAVGLELLRVADETVVETDSLLLGRKARLEADQLAGFAARVKGRLVPVPVAAVQTPPVATDVPTTTVLVPAQTASTTVTVTPSPAPRSHAPSFVLGGVGLASLIAGATLVILGASARAPLTAGQPGPDGRIRSALDVTQAQQLNASTQPLVFGGLGALVAGAGLGTAAVLTW